MKPVTLIVGINLFIILVYSLLIRFYGLDGEPARGLALMVESMWVIGIHVIANVVIGAICQIKDGKLGQPWFLSAGVVLLVGFSACLGNGML